MCCDDFLLQFTADFKSYIVMICQKKKYPKTTTLTIFISSQKTCKFDSQVCVVEYTDPSALTKRTHSPEFMGLFAWQPNVALS